MNNTTQKKGVLLRSLQVGGGAFLVSSLGWCSFHCLLVSGAGALRLPPFFWACVAFSPPPLGGGALSSLLVWRIPTFSRELNYKTQIIYFKSLT